jgi:hypothetical protein
MQSFSIHDSVPTTTGSTSTVSQLVAEQEYRNSQNLNEYSKKSTGVNVDPGYSRYAALATTVRLRSYEDCL